MSDNKPVAEVDITKAWQASQNQKGAAKRLRIFAALAWVVAIGCEIAGIVLLKQHKFDHGNLAAIIHPVGQLGAGFQFWVGRGRVGSSPVLA